MQAIGYRQVVEHLRGERPLAETIEQVKIRTRQFAKRQLTWFRRQLDPEWIELKPEQAPAGAAENDRTVLSVAPAGACDSCAIKPTADRRGLLSAAPPALKNQFAITRFFPCCLA
jgi:hypothetical protein